MAKQSEWSVMRDQDKWLTVPLRGYIYIYVCGCCGKACLLDPRGECYG